MRQRADTELASIRSRTAHAGFTLIELLVVIAIIAILTAILLPIFSNAKATAYSTKCKSNLRQQGIALRIYLDEREQYPFWQTWTVDGRLAWDTSLLEISRGQREIFLCPAMKRLSAWNGAFSPSYGYNICGTGKPGDNALGLGGPIGPLPEGTTTYRPMKEPEILMPSEMMAVGEYGEDDAQHGEIAFHSMLNYIVARHKRVANVLFCDGHVEQDMPANWMKASDAARRRWNRDYEPHPETW
jgi:prepilin-type N-terminal cleavage/methylation domain-containing protein/prepilin-type processing-associated H-X9-DG protein